MEKTSQQQNNKTNLPLRSLLEIASEPGCHVQTMLNERNPVPGPEGLKTNWNKSLQNTNTFFVENS